MGSKDSKPALAIAAPTTVVSTKAVSAAAVSAAAAPAAGAAPTSLQYTHAAPTYSEDIAIAPNNPIVTGGTPTGWETDRPLPAGLDFNTSTGVITGTPKRMLSASAVPVVITARNAHGRVQTTISISVQVKLRTKVACMVDHDIFDETLSERAITCGAGTHSMCNAAFHAYFRVTLGQSDVWPLRCPDPKCKKEFAMSELDRVLSDDERKLFARRSLENSIRAGTREVLVQCGSCQNMVIYPEGKDPDMMHCTECKGLTCRGCNQSVTGFIGQDHKAGSGGRTATKALADNKSNDQLVQTHLIVCSLYRTAQDIINKGLNMRCPSCGIKRQKEVGDCVHMTCECLTVWCYCCGRARGDAMCAGSAAGTWGTHNQDFKNKNDHCPWWLREIHTADFKEWPASDEDALMFFHKQRVLRGLKQFIATIPKESIDALLATYPGAFGGFDLVEISNFKETSFYTHRKPPPL